MARQHFDSGRPEHIGCFHTDVVVDGKNRVSACFPFLHSEMMLCKQGVQVVPCGIAACEQGPNTRSDLSAYIGLQRLYILIVL